ncbi:mucin-2-like [Anopheles bellator]|uniref:mucin-2-like n=1 Tax=Anopheles bellator TaxID=139047 RepID=UPI002647822F|nr:mucin-2-like [Anopheles bellator]
MLTIIVMHNSDGALAAENNMRVVCYYTNWSVYRPGTAKFTPQNINPYLCTHLIYSFGGFTKENNLKPYDKYQDIEQGGFAKFTGLKTYNKQLKTMLAIGGWNEGSSRFSPLVADAQRREQFTRNTIKFLRQYHFDGLDLDWEYPAFRDGSKPKDRENYAQLVQELREEFEREATKTGRPRLLLTMAVPAGVEYLEKGYDLQKLNKYLDWFNLLSYDYHSAYEPAVNHHSPLFSVEEASEYTFDSELNIDYSVKYFLNAGADRDKLVLGIPTYGRSYTLYNPDATGIGAPADGPGEQGDSTREKGYLAYYEICSNLKKNSDWTIVQPNPKALGPYAYKGNQWVGYDDEAIARIKAKYVAENNLGGIMFWSIDNDDFRGTCHGKPYPIIEAAKEALLANTNVGANDITSPSGLRKINRSRKRPTTHNRVNTVNNNDIKPSFNSMQDRKVGNHNRIVATTTASTTTTEGSWLIGGRTTTPQPPTTPDPGADFKCTDEGFFPHPRDCKKYFWCLESPSLGLVAHHFTCPSGLVFNKLADSCDYARNVICSKHAPITSTTNILKTSARTTPVQSTSTTQRSRITTSGSRVPFFNRSATTTTTTSTTTEEPVVETGLMHEEDTEQQPEEDPKVIKELIALIKKVGGIEELEKQLQGQGDDPIVLTDTEVTDSISTTPSTTISKSLYERVLSHTTGTVGQKFRPGITFSQKDHTWTSPDNKYSSVVRKTYSNSRVAPQNEGLDLLPEFEGVFREKPKYVTLNRARPTNPSLIEDRFDDSNSHEGEEDLIYEGENQTSSVASKRIASNTKYVNIMRHRPSIASEQEEKGDNDEETHESFIQHSILNRNRFKLTTEPTQAAAEETERALPSRYNIIDRRRPSSVQYSRLQMVNRDDVGTDSSFLVPSTDFQTIYTTAPITISNVTRPSEKNSTSYSTLQSRGVTSVSANANNSSIVGSNIISSSISADKSNSSNSTYGGTVQAQSIPYFSMTTSLNDTNIPNSDVPSKHQQHEQHYVLNVDYQVEAPVEASDTIPTIANPTGDLLNAIELTLESTTVPYQSEDVSAGDSTGVFGSFTESDITLGIEMKKGTAGYNASVKTTTNLSSTLPIKTTTTTIVPILIPTNDAPPHNVKFKFMQRTRKPLTTTTTTLEPITNIGTGSDFIPTKATPRPFTSGLRRTRPTHLSVGITKNSAASSVMDANLTTLRSVKVSFSNSQTLESLPGRQRRVGNAATDSDAINGGRLVEKQNAEAMRLVPHSNRGRVRFRSSIEQETVHSGDRSESINDKSFPALSTSFSSVNSLSSPAALRRRSRPSSSAEFAANRFAVGRASTVPSTDTADLKKTTSTLSSIRRANFNLYSGRGTTIKQEMKFGSSTETTTTSLDARTSYDTVTINPDLIKTYTHVAENPLMAQERILLTLGTALRYGFNNRNHLTNDHKIKLVQEHTIATPTINSVPFVGRPFGNNHQNAANMANNAYDEVDVNVMSTEAINELYATKRADLFTLYSVNTTKVNTTTPQERKVTVASYVLPTRVAPERTNIEQTDTTIKVMISKENTNKTFIHGRTRPTSSTRLRTTSRPVNSDGTIIKEQDAIDGTKPVPESSRKAFERHPPKTHKQSQSRSTSTINEEIDHGPSIFTTKRQRGSSSSRRRNTTPTTPSTTNAGYYNNQFSKTLSDQRLFASRTMPITKTVPASIPDDSTVASLFEAVTVEATLSDSKVANSDFTTVISADMSNELAHSFNILNSDNLSTLSEFHADNDNKEATYIADDWTLETLATPMVTEKFRFQTAVSTHNSMNQLFNDSQQIESESILSRSPIRGVGVTSNAVRKFTEYILPTKPSEPTEQTRKYVPTRRDRPSFSLARNSRLYTTTPTENTAFDSLTSVTTTTPSNGPFVPQRRRKPLPRDKVINNSTNNDDESSEVFSTRTTRRRPANSLNRLSRPQSFEDSFDKATVPTKPFEHKIINRTSVLLPKRPNLFARTTMSTTTTGKPIFVIGDETTDDRILKEEVTSEKYGHYSVQEEDNEIMRQSKKLFGSVGSDVANSVLSESSELPIGFRRPASLGQYLRISSGVSRVTTGTSSNRFIFNNNQPSTDGATMLAASTTTQRSITTRSRRPFGNVSGYKPTTQNLTTIGGTGGLVTSLPGGITTPRPRFTPTTRARFTFGRQRSTTFSTSSAIERNAFGEDQPGSHAPQSGAEPDLSSIIARRYQPRKQTSRRNLTATTESKLNTELNGVSKRNRTNQSSLFPNSEKQGRSTIPPSLLLITTTEMDSNTVSTPLEGSHKMTTSLPMSEAITSFASKPLPSTGRDNMTSLAVTSAATTISKQRLADNENEIVENTTAYLEDALNTFRTTTEYYTASDETHYTTLNTADTIYTINDNIDIDDVNVLQDRGRTSTTTIKPTTLYHVFSIDKENESVPSSTEIYRTEEQEIELPATNGTDKLVQIHRVVEIYSKNFSSPDELPVMQKLGEINRKIIIRLVEPNRANKTTNSSSSVSTSATMFGSSGAEYPATATEGTDRRGKNANEIQGPNIVLSSNSIFTVETSTIPLEGLFDPELKSEFDFPTTQSPPVDLDTVAPQQDFERISSVEFATTNAGNMAAVDDEHVTITPFEVATEHDTQVTETRNRSSLPPYTSNEYEYNDNQIMAQRVPGEQKRIVTTNSATNNTITAATTATEAAPMASSTQREIVHKYTLPAEFSFQEPASEATPKTTTRTVLEVTTITEEVPTTSQIPKTMKPTATVMKTTTITENPETPTVERVQPLVVLPSKESKLKYVKRPTGQKPTRLLDFAYNRDADSNEQDDDGQLATIKPLMTEHSQTNSLKANTARLFPNGRKYVSLLSQRTNLTLPDTAATTLNTSSSFRKSKDILVLLPPKTTTPMTTTPFTKSVNTITKSNIPTTRPTVITKIDFNIKYVLPASFPDREAHKLKIESKSDKYSIPLSPILRPDFVTREISGERQERQFSPVYRPELDNDELTRLLTSDSDPVALEAASLHREILDSDATDKRTLPSLPAYFQRRSAEVPMKPIPIQ